MANSTPRDALTLIIESLPGASGEALFQANRALKAMDRLDLDTVSIISRKFSGTTYVHYLDRLTDVVRFACYLWLCQYQPHLHSRVKQCQLDLDSSVSKFNQCLKNGMYGVTLP